MKIPNILIKKHSLIDFIKYDLAKYEKIYEKISIGIIVALIMFPFSCFLTLLHKPSYFFSCFFSSFTGFPVVIIYRLWVSILFIEALLFDFFRFHACGGIAYFGTILLVIVLFFILYYFITNKIFHEPHKIRKILLGFIIVYLIILCEIPIIIGFRPY